MDARKLIVLLDRERTLITKALEVTQAAGRGSLVRAHGKRRLDAATSATTASRSPPARPPPSTAS